MSYILRKEGYVYLVEGDKGFETFYYMGKDIDSPMWKDEVEEMKRHRTKKKKTKKRE